LGAWIRGRIHLGSTLRTFTIGNSTNADIDTRIDASITGTAGLTKAGAGRLEIAGPISLSGTFTVNNGEVLLSNPNSALPAVTLGGIAGVQPVLDTGSTTASLNGLLAYSSGNNGLGSILRGRLDLGSALRTFTINNSTNAPVDMKIEAALDGIAGFTKNGAGTLELAGINSLTGPVSCTAGVLSISNAQAFAAVSSVSISSGGALDFTTLPSATFVVSRPDLVISGVGNVIGNLSLAGGRLASPGSGNLTISGDLVATSGTTEIKTGSSPGVIVVSGNATLGGRLEVTMGGSLTGTQTVTLLTANSINGSYASVQLPTPPAGTVYALETTGTQVRMRVFPGSASQAWLGGNGIAIDAPLTSDPDGDGVSLLEEYALGGSPTGSDSHLTSAASTAAGTELRFNWNTAATDINGFVEASSDLQSWTTILSKTGSSPWTGTASFSQGTPVGSVFPIIVRDPIPTLPRFLRVRAVKP
jgi:autotransporter-associated beta strand protein